VKGWEMGKTVCVITETTVDLPKGFAKKKNITLIPIHILINNKSHRHGIDIINQEVVEHLIQKDDVSTEPPTPREYCSVFKVMSEKFDKIYSLHVSSDLSDCYENAKRGLRLLRKKQKTEERGIYSNNIKVIDTRAASISQGQIVNRIASIVKKKFDEDKLDKYIAWLINKSKMVFVVDDLYWLKKAGQLNFISGFFGGLFDIKPVILLEDGKLTPVDKPRGKGTAIYSMLTIIEQAVKKYKKGAEIWIAHSASLLDAKHVQKQLSESCKIEVSKIPIIEVGPTISAHTGPGVVSVSILPK
jgi:DegV family protein with EDD domain